MSVPTEPYTCARCELIGTFGTAPRETAGVVNVDEVDALGNVPDPVWHERGCPGANVHAHGAFFHYACPDCGLCCRLRSSHAAATEDGVRHQAAKAQAKAKAAAA